MVFNRNSFPNTKDFLSLGTLQAVVYTLKVVLHPFNGPFSGTIWVSWCQKGKTNLDFTEAKDNEWQWHQLDR